MRSRLSWKAPLSYPDSLASSKRISEKRTKFPHGSAMRVRKSAHSQNATNERLTAVSQRNNAAPRPTTNCGDENGLKKNSGSRGWNRGHFAADHRGTMSEMGSNPVSLHP